MKKTLLCFVLTLSLIFALCAYAEMTNIFAYESINVPVASAIGFTAGTIHPTGGMWAKEAFCTVETANIRWRADGTDPTAAEGHPLTTTDISVAISGEESLAKFRAFSSGATTAVLKCSYAR